MHLVLVDIPAVLDDPLRRALGPRHRISTLSDVTDRDRCRDVASCDVLIHGHIAADARTMIDKATRGTWNLLTTTKARRVVHLSSMRIFDGYPANWAIDESWLPRPTTHPESLAAYLAELTSRELARVHPDVCVAARLDRVVPADVFDAGPIQPDWLHVADASRAIVRIVESDVLPIARARWQPVHVVRGDTTARFPLGVAAGSVLSCLPEHVTATPAPRPVSAPALPADPEPLDGLAAPRAVTMFGAGGPLGAAATRAMGPRHRLLLTDSRPLVECAAAGPQSPGAPLPSPPSPPHHEEVVDITDPDAVRAAAVAAECLVNCAVVRTESDRAFAVNVLGAFNVMRAAADAGIPRVVHTGPALVFERHPIGYNDDRNIGPTTPPRAGDDLYFLTKFLGQEITRILAEEHRIACPVLLFCGFVNPTAPRQHPVHPFSISWADAGRAIAAAATVPQLPEPCPVLHLHTESPHGRYRSTSAQTILGWRPQDRLDRYWHRWADH